VTGGACSAYGGEKHIQVFGREYNIKMELQEVGRGSMEWMELAQDRDRWCALVTAVMNPGFHKIGGISRLAENLLASQKGLCSMEYVNK